MRGRLEGEGGGGYTSATLVRLSGAWVDRGQSGRARCRAGGEISSATRGTTNYLLSIRLNFARERVESAKTGASASRRDRKVSKGETRNRTGEKEAWRSRGIRVGEKKGRGKKEFTNYKMQLSAFVRGVSRSIEAVPGFESGWRSFCTGCVIYRR